MMFNKQTGVVVGYGVWKSALAEKKNEHITDSLLDLNFSQIFTIVRQLNLPLPDGRIQFSLRSAIIGTLRYNLIAIRRRNTTRNYLLLSSEGHCPIQCVSRHSLPALPVHINNSVSKYQRSRHAAFANR